MSDLAKDIVKSLLELFELLGIDEITEDTKNQMVLVVEEEINKKELTNHKLRDAQIGNVLERAKDNE